MPARFLVVVLVVLAATVGRRSVAAAGRATVTAARGEVRETGVLHLVALGAILAVAAALRLDHVFGPMRWDESYTFLTYGSKPVADAASLYDYPNNHVFHSLLVHLSCATLSDLRTCGPAAIRVPVFVAGVALPLAAYVAAARLFTREIAIVVAALLAGSGQLAEYSTNARGYELAALATVVLIALAPDVLRSPNPTYCVLFAVVGALGFYTVPVMVYPFAVVVVAAGLAIAVGFAAPRRDAAIRLAGAVAGTIVLTILLYGPILDEVLRGGSAGQPNEYADEVRPLAKEVWRLWTLGTPALVKDLLLAAFAASAVAAAIYRRRTIPLAAAFVLVLASAIAAHRVAPFTRVWLPLLPVFVMCVIAGILDWPRVREFVRRPLASAVISVLAIAIAGSLALIVERNGYDNTDPSYLPASEPIAKALLPRLRSGDHVLVTIPGWAMEAYAFNRVGLGQELLSLQIDKTGAATGQTYLIVNRMTGETPESALDATANGTGLKPGERIGTFREADVYTLTQSG